MPLTASASLFPYTTLFRSQVGPNENFVETVRNELNGNIPFSKLSYTEANTGKNKADQHPREKPVSRQLRVTYDPMVLAFTVVVTDLGGGKLSAVVKTQPAH